MSCWAILPCRSQSSRLYCKPLQRLGERTILEHQINNIRSLNIVDGIVLAIAAGRSNENFVEFAEEHKLPYVRGSEPNVLERVIKAVQMIEVTTFFRMSTECPFIYAKDAREIFQRHVEGGYDFTSILHLPLGTTYELIKASRLKDIAATGDRRYWVAISLYLFERQEQMRLQLMEPEAACRRPEIRLAVDYPAQLIFCQRAYEALRTRGEPIPLEDIVRYYDENPMVAALLNSVQEDVFAPRSDGVVTRVWA